MFKLYRYLLYHWYYRFTNAVLIFFCYQMLSNESKYNEFKENVKKIKKYGTKELISDEMHIFNDFVMNDVVDK